MNCPKCGHHIDGHRFDGFNYRYICDGDYCNCDISPIDALKAAKRLTAAIAHLRGIAKRHRIAFSERLAVSVDIRIEFNHALAAYRAVGILPTLERKP